MSNLDCHCETSLAHCATSLLWFTAQRCSSLCTSFQNKVICIGKHPIVSQAQGILTSSTPSDVTALDVPLSTVMAEPIPVPCKPTVLVPPSPSLLSIVCQTLGPSSPASPVHGESGSYTPSCACPWFRSGSTASLPPRVTFKPRCAGRSPEVARALLFPSMSSDAAVPYRLAYVIRDLVVLTPSV